MFRNGLTSITIENFKGIGAPVTVPLRPVTLLFGANSAGKSTIIQALQYAWEVLENRNPDVDRTRIGGEVIDLGGFRSLVHQHDLERSIKISLEYQGRLMNREYMLPDLHYSDALEAPIAYEYNDDITEWTEISNFSVGVAVAWNNSISRPIISYYEVALNGVPFGRLQTSPESHSQILLNKSHPLFSIKDDYAKKVMDRCIMDCGTIEERLRLHLSSLSPEAKEALLSELRSQLSNSLSSDSKTDSVDAKLLNSLTQQGSMCWSRSAIDAHTIPEWGRRLSFSAESIRTETSTISEETISVLSQVMVGAGETLLNALRGLRYLGPLRAVPDRQHAAPLRAESGRWADGLGAWDALLRNPVSADGVSLVDRCSEYLHHTLGIPYTLRREDRVQLDADGTLFARLRLMASRFEEIESEAFKQLVSEIEALGRVPVVQLHDEKNDIDVSPMDIGVGVSQTLPVVVGAVEPNCTIYAVEQPELHIHPAVQVNLADVFLREALEPGKKPRIFLLETHSEHLILRIMRRMRESSDNALPEDFPAVTPEDVAVLYVEPSEIGVQVIEIPITEDGEFDRPWPKGFFAERAQELM